MPSIIKRGDRFRALVRMAGHRRCETFAPRKAAEQWAKRVESEIEEMRASGVMQPRGLTIANLIDRYIEELYPQKQWGRSKTADLVWLKREFGHIQASQLTSHHVVKIFRDAHRLGAGPVTISARAGYLVGVLKIARTVWHLDVPLQAAQDARSALGSVGLTGKSRRRDRR